jgi:hypothetical protein
MTRCYNADDLAAPAQRSGLGWMRVGCPSELVDVQELIGSLDRKRRLARTVARDAAGNP